MQYVMAAALTSLYVTPLRFTSLGCLELFCVAAWLVALEEGDKSLLTLPGGKGFLLVRWAKMGWVLSSLVLSSGAEVAAATSCMLSGWLPPQRS